MDCLFKTAEELRNGVGSPSDKHAKVVTLKVDVAGLQLKDIWMTASILSQIHLQYYSSVHPYCLWDTISLTQSEYQLSVS